MGLFLPPVLATWVILHRQKSLLSMNSQQPDEQNQPDRAEDLDENLATARFPVVGIGASAGGLDAFRKLLSHLPTDTGMAFVLIQHLGDL